MRFTHHLLGHCLLLLLNFASCCLATGTELANLPAETLVDRLANVDSEGVGFYSMASYRGFIALDRPAIFSGGVIGSPPPKITADERELVRRGPKALSVLIAHLNDKRPTRLEVGGPEFMFQGFSDEYDPRLRQRRDLNVTQDFGNYVAMRRQKGFRGTYRVKIGDLCSALIGQITNRMLLPVRYQATAGLIINSPVESANLRRRIRRDWKGKDSSELLRQSLLRDICYLNDEEEALPALQRLHFYFPDSYAALRASRFNKQIQNWEARAKLEPR